MGDNQITRRQFLGQASLVAAATVLTPGLLTAKGFSKKGLGHISHHERCLTLYNMHTGEWFKGPYRVKGVYLPEALAQLTHLLRDWRNDKTHPIDLRLLDLVYDLQRGLHLNRPFDVISGYRSPETNALLHHKSKGVAKNSLHKQGLAIDIKLPTHLQKLRDLARSLRKGGVGYYSQPGFVHVDIRPKVVYWGK